MMKDCGFINATKLCSDGGKYLKNWYANQSSKDLLRCLATKLGEDGDIESIFVFKVVRTAQQTDAEKSVSGTYYNPLIIPHIACWISPDFAIIVSDIVNDFLVGEYKKCLEEEQARRRRADVRATEEQSRRLNAEQWAKEEKAGREVVTQLLQLTEEQNEVMKRELAYADEEVKEKDKALDDKNVEIARKGAELDDKNVEIARKGAELAVAGSNLVNVNARLNTATTTIMKSRADLTLWSCTHSFAILKVNEENARGTYYAIRRRRSDMRATTRKFTNKYPQATIMFHQKFIPNGVNLFQRLKTQRLIKSHQNFFNINTCEHDLVDKINGMSANVIRPAIVNFSHICS